MCVFVHNEIKRLESNHIYCIKCVFNPPEEHWLHLTTIYYESNKMTLCRGRTQFPFVMFCPYHQLSSQDNKKASQTLDKTSIMMFYHKFTHPHQFFSLSGHFFYGIEVGTHYSTSSNNFERLSW